MTGVPITGVNIGHRRVHREDAMQSLAWEREDPRGPLPCKATREGPTGKLGERSAQSLPGAFKGGCPHLDLRLLVSRSVRQEVSVFLTPSLWSAWTEALECVFHCPQPAGVRTQEGASREIWEKPLCLICRLWGKSELPQADPRDPHASAGGAGPGGVLAVGGHGP